MRNKAQATSLSDILVGLVVIGLIGTLVFLFITRGQDIEVRVEENELIRRKITLTNALLSSDKLVYVSVSNVNRGILDKEKLDNLASNSELFSDISYSETGYSIKVVDLDENKEWLIGKNFDSGLKSPVAIRYSEDEIHLGSLSVEFNLKESLITTELDTCQKITKPGYYKLTRNLNEDDILPSGLMGGDGNCFEIEAKDVTLDCDNHLIEGRGFDKGLGVVVSGDNTIVKNCEIKDFLGGIKINSNSNKIENNQIESITIGLEIQSSSNEIISNSISQASQVGIMIWENDNELMNNRACDSSDQDIYLQDGKDASGNGNTCDETYNYNDESVTGCSRLCTQEPPDIPASKDRYVEKIREVETEIKQEYPDFPDNLLLGIGLTETSLKHFDLVTGRVIRGGSGEVGLMQIIPGTAGCTEQELMGWERNIECGGELLLAKYDAYKDEDETYDPSGCGYSYSDPWERAVRGYNGWGCPSNANKQYVCTVYENAGLPVPNCP